ncbi:hypothetical protein ACLB2K_029187 [Fragaria x ananassa]
MELIKIMLIIATTMALSITLMTVNRVGREEEDKPSFESDEHPLYGQNNLLLPSKRVSRFLAETKNPRAADHCNKDNEICAYLAESNINSTCCNNKCMDLSEDKHNCGACKKKCKYTDTCCRGGCVDTNFDKRHCGGCNNRCEKGQYCVYGMCNYA